MSSLGIAGAVGGSRRAFSLLELVLVIAITATLSAVAIPRYANSIVNYRLEMAARRIVADLDWARNNARISSASRTVTFSVDNNNYQIPNVKNLTDASTTYEVDLSGDLYRASLVSANFGGDLFVVFDGYGVPSSGGVVVVAAGGIQKTVALDANTARAEVQ